MRRETGLTLNEHGASFSSTTEGISEEGVQEKTRSHTKSNGPASHGGASRGRHRGRPYEGEGVVISNGEKGGGGGETVRNHRADEKSKTQKAPTSGEKDLHQR